MEMFSHAHIQMLSQDTSSSRFPSLEKLCLSTAARDKSSQPFALPTIGLLVSLPDMLKLDISAILSREHASFISAITCRRPTREESGSMPKMED